MKKNIIENYMKLIKMPILLFQQKYINRKQEQAKKDVLTLALVNVKTEIMVVKSEIRQNDANKMLEK